MWNTWQEELAAFFSLYHIAFMGEAFAHTLALSWIGALAGFGIGFCLALCRHPRLFAAWPQRTLAIAYVEVFRRIPFLVKLMCVFFAFQFAGIRVSLFAVALTTVVLSAAAFSAEIIRGGLDSIPGPQWDAAEAMNMSRIQTLRRVVLPQAWRIMLPPGFGYVVGFIKSTSIASQIGVLELTYAAKVMNTKGFSALLCFGTVLLLYFAICFPTKMLGERLERRLNRPTGR
ncbi:amino acid ABC transporter permease [Humitalea sp. 24SJ18S-53]|uniref:amino acid ABC transporter permease n=1 Tax=Humitalea sp. 24SJ18S-53 TaxID=3422307 RepID=UPI003D675B56